MKKILVLFGMMILLIGCAEGDPTIEGYVTAIEFDEMLVSTTNGKAFWLYGLADDAEVGDYVEVWGKDIEQSNPPRAEAKTLYGYESEKPDGASLSEKKALQQALNKTYIAEPIIQKMKFKEEDDTWYFEFKDAETGKMYEIQVYE